MLYREIIAVRLSVHIAQLDSNWADFNEISY
jgi:hypothetical protein